MSAGELTEWRSYVSTRSINVFLTTYDGWNCTLATNFGFPEGHTEINATFRIPEALPDGAGDTQLVVIETQVKPATDELYVPPFQAAAPRMYLW